MVRRRAHIIDTFIHLVARDGLEAITVDRVAGEANVQRSAVRHFVGNRRALINAAIVELSVRRVESIRRALAGDPDISELITLTFSADWPETISDERRAFAALVHEAAHDPNATAHVLRAYEALLAEVRSALHRSHPGAAPARIGEIAYTLVCLVEQNNVMQRLGYPASLSRGAARAARELVKALA